MNITIKINLIWITLLILCFGFSLYQAVFNNIWGPLVGFAVGTIIALVFMRK